MIPTISHHVWLGDKPKRAVELEGRRSFLSLHQTWLSFVHTDGRLLASREFDPIRPELESAWKRFIVGDVRHSGDTIRADILRLVALYLYGGVYADHDLFFIKPMDEFLDRPLLLADWCRNNPGEYLIGCEPGNRDIFDVLTDFVRGTYGAIITMNLAQHKRKKGWHSFHPDFFCPHLMVHPDRRYRTTPDTHAIHCWRKLEYDIPKLWSLQCTPSPKQ